MGAKIPQNKIGGTSGHGDRHDVLELLAVEHPACRHGPRGTTTPALSNDGHMIDRNHEPGRDEGMPRFMKGDRPD